MTPFDPHDGEEEAAYIARISRELPDWPTEVLREWLFRHRGADDYAFLDYRRFRFKRETWPNDAVPGAEAFHDGWSADFGSNLEDRVAGRGADGIYWGEDWLARYMWQHGKWNTPIILLHNPPPPRVSARRATEVAAASSRRAP